MTHPPPLTTPAKLSRVLASFNAPGFRLFYANNTFAAVDMNVRVAVHGWLVLEVSGDSELWVGIYALVLGMGQVLFSPVAGAIADRFQRRTVLLAEGVLSAVVAGGLAAAVYLDAAHLALVVAIAFVVGCQRAVRFTAGNRFVYDIVGARQLVNGAALWRVSATPMMIFGALLAGALIDWVGIWAAYAFMSASLLVSLPPLWLIRVKGYVEQTRVTLFGQTVEGVRFAVQSPALRTLFTVSVVMESLGFAFLIMVPVMAKNVLEVGGTGLGVLQAGIGTGMLVAAFVMAARGDTASKPQTVFVCAVGAGLALIGFAVSRSLPLSFLFAAGVMGFLNAYDMTLGALMQLVSPPHLRGRAVSLHSLAVSFTALGGFVMGVVGGVVGVPLVLAASGGGIVANSVWRRGAILGIRERSGDDAGAPALGRSGADVEPASGGLG